VNVHFTCPNCELPAYVDGSATGPWQCPRCTQRIELGGAEKDGAMAVCAVCGNAELYKKKDFPHWLGLTILTVACLAFVLLNAFYQQWWGWAVLIGSALIDGILYLRVGDAVVCYRCGALYRSVPGAADYKPFELAVGERYRQERLRREELRKQ
jgi:hypothetical protein